MATKAYVFPTLSLILGLWLSPLAEAEIKTDEHVVFFNAAAHWANDSQQWLVPIHGWIYEPTQSSVRKTVLAELLERQYGIVVDQQNSANFDRRIDLFLADNERGKRIEIQLGTHRQSMPASRPNGHFRGQLALAAAEVERLADANGWLQFRTSAADGRQFSGQVQLIAATGLSIVSDIDDTIKITEVHDRVRLLENTFLQDFEPVPGMAELYRAWAASEPDVRFHFVSSSPWQLYQPLVEFATAAGFPAATFHLKEIRFKDRTFWNLFKPGSTTKPELIEPLLHAYPARRFILVGDSGEEDPEVYARLLREYPQQVLRVYIHNVTSASAADQRFRTLFQGIAADRWQLFTDPRDIELR